MAKLFRVLEQQANSVEVEHLFVAIDEAQLRAEIQKEIDGGTFSSTYVPQEMGDVVAVDGTPLMGPTVLTRDANDPNIWHAS